MRVDLDFNSKVCLVKKEEGDKSIPISGWIRQYGGDPSSILLYKVKRILQKRGYKIVKTRMCKDGHLTDAERQYLVTRYKHTFNFCILDNLYQLRDARDDYNKNGYVTLAIEF